MNPDAPVVQIQNVSKNYAAPGQVAHAALKNASLSIAPGEVFALLGPNGAGKTTLLRILTGILLPDSGNVRVLGAEGRAAAQQVRSRVGYLPEERGLYKKQKVGDILVYLGELKGLSPRRRPHAHPAWFWSRSVWPPMKTVWWNQFVQRYGAAHTNRLRAWCMTPPLVILDEPFSGLDPVSARQAQDLVQSGKSAGPYRAYCPPIKWNPWSDCATGF